ncbi:hypothetical protein [endosymbiont of Ridgeia piscesae]|jgi:hypothetical protein|uniref:Uncharacterized protein n=1 Tax=endosymbiont of Ridgeia piscesae TaxID=54398 RepID=A0A0T5Z763_9GAMM|nr:hypothetical protein [endosymbiont of Ridgeia piscesae]KRT54892.1 hypothetical protein Ga0074115_11115 [endosymbiont of Ridgeia piscesae]KRT58672.1 hypothetical protein Ga0076813_139310 [endosymbiont of Ridgeia piscesae]
MGSRLFWLFPAQSRYLPGHRWINITLRTLHLVGIAGIGGGFFYAAEGDLWKSFLWLTLGSGLLLSLLFIYANGIWLLQLRGHVIMLKLLLLYGVTLWPEWAPWLVVLVVILSGWISHATGDVRYYSLFHRRRLERLDPNE